MERGRREEEREAWCWEVAVLEDGRRKTAGASKSMDKWIIGMKCDGNLRRGRRRRGQRKRHGAAECPSAGEWKEEDSRCQKSMNW